MNKQKMTWQPISFLPKIAIMIDGMLESAEENVVNLSQAKDRPHSMDNYTVSRIFEVYGTQKADLWMYIEQLDIWNKTKINAKQKKEVARLLKQLDKLEAAVYTNLKIGGFLKDKTIEKVMDKDDAELGLEYLMGILGKK